MVVAAAATVIVETCTEYLLYAGSVLLPLSASSEFRKVEDVGARESAE